MPKQLMRKQYHFRPSERGLLAWDVHRLVEESKGLEPVKVPLAEIKELDQPYWFSTGEMPTCRRVVEHMRLVEEADLKFPIILCAEGRVMDGMHRVAKASLRGDESITALRFPKTPEPDFVGVAPENLPY